MQPIKSGEGKNMVKWDVSNDQQMLMDLIPIIQDHS